MNEVSQNKKDSVLKSLAIAGFIGIIILIAWASIQLVGFVPGAFSSLASLAEGLRQAEQTASVDNKITPLTVTSNTILVKAGETVELSWNTTETPGSYTFSYNCTDGVAVDVNNIAGVRSIACDTNYNIGNTDSISLSVDSEKKRYTDVVYTIAFLGTEDTDPRALGTSSITVVNSEVQSIIIEDESDTSTIVTEEPEPENEPVVVEPTEPKPVTPTPVETPEVVTKPTPKPPVYEQEFVYTIPVSDPNGRTDLATKFLNIGNIVGKTFFSGVIKQDSNGAIQFEVKNLGTKTSDEWTFDLSMPNGGTYKSTKQIPLKPNERAVITIGFTTTNDTNHTFVVTVDEPTDNRTLNDKFSQAVTFIK